MTGASGAPGRKPGLQGLTGRKPRPAVCGVPGHRGATEDQGPAFLPDRGRRGAGGRLAGLGPDLGPVPRWPDHGRRAPGAAATAPDQGTGRAVRQGEGVAALAGACCMDQDREFLPGQAGHRGGCLAFKGSQAASRAPLCGAYRGTGAQQTIKASSSCRIGADMGPVAGSLILGLILGLCPAGRIMDEGRPEPPPRPRIRTQGGRSGKVKGWRRWPGSWPGPAAWIRTGNFDRGKRGTGAEARPSGAHRPRAAPRCAGRTGAPGRNGRSRPRLPAGSGQTWGRCPDR